MAIIIFGGDRLGKIPLLLKEEGFDLAQHVTGRKKGHLKKIEIPDEIEGILVFTDFLNHSLAAEVKAVAKRKGIKTIFVKRSWSQIKETLKLLQTAVQEE